MLCTVLSLFRDVDVRPVHGMFSNVLSGHDSVKVSYHSTRALHCAHAAAYALCRVDDGAVIDHMHRIRRTVLLAKPTGYTGIRASIECSPSRVLIAALRLYVIDSIYDFYDALRARART